jgi:hypothetical protein
VDFSELHHLNPVIPQKSVDKYRPPRNMIRLATTLLLLLNFVMRISAAEGNPTIKPMTLESFANSTIEVIKEDGIDEYLPTIVLSAINQVRVIEGIPDEVDHKEAIQNVVRRSGYQDQEFFFGVLSSSGVITVGHYRPGQVTKFMKITMAGDDYKATVLEGSEWWKVKK